MTDGLLWMAAGIALILVLTRRLREERNAPRPENFSVGKSPLRFGGSRHGGIFSVKVVALEFDEAGPVIFVNGNFQNDNKTLEIDVVVADVETGGGDEAFISFDPDVGTGRGEKRMGDLVNLTAPVVLEPDERGMFRAPLFSPDREERLGDIIERLDGAAARMVEKFDREFGVYSLEGQSLERLESDFTRDYVVREIAEQIEREFIWRVGRLGLTIQFLTNGDEVIEEIPLDFNLEKSDVGRLRENIEIILVNSLRVELELEPVPYNSVVFERP